eukprot:762690-Pyramimonas_sp.AAC.1
MLKELWSHGLQCLYPGLRAQRDTDWDEPWLRQRVFCIANGKKHGKGGGRPADARARARGGALLLA